MLHIGSAVPPATLLPHHCSWTHHGSGRLLSAAEACFHDTHQLSGRLQTILQVQRGGALQCPFLHLCVGMLFNLLPCPAHQWTSTQLSKAASCAGDERIRP